MHYVIIVIIIIIIVCVCINKISVSEKGKKEKEKKRGHFVSFQMDLAFTICLSFHMTTWYSSNDYKVDFPLPGSQPNFQFLIFYLRVLIIWTCIRFASGEFSWQVISLSPWHDRMYTSQLMILLYKHTFVLSRIVIQTENTRF